MLTGESWWEYVQRVCGRNQQKDIAALINVDASSITRWKEGKKPRAENVIAFARALKVPVIEALMAAGYLTEEDVVNVPIVQGTIKDFPNSELVVEMHRRLDTNDPRRIEPGSASDVFPRFDEGNRGQERARSTQS